MRIMGKRIGGNKGIGVGRRGILIFCGCFLLFCCDVYWLGICCSFLLIGCEVVKDLSVD